MNNPKFHWDWEQELYESVTKAELYEILRNQFVTDMYPIFGDDDSMVLRSFKQQLRFNKMAKEITENERKNAKS